MFHIMKKQEREANTMSGDESEGETPDVGQGRTYMAQKFVSPPFLINGHKAVLRMFVVVTSFAPLRMYLHDAGIVFFTGLEYSTKDVTDRRAYITDYYMSEAQVSVAHIHQRIYCQSLSSFYHLKNIVKMF